MIINPNAHIITYPACMHAIMMNDVHYNNYYGYSPKLYYAQLCTRVPMACVCVCVCVHSSSAG